MPMCSSRVFSILLETLNECLMHHAYVFWSCVFHSVAGSVRVFDACMPMCSSRVFSILLQARCGTERMC